MFRARSRAPHSIPLPFLRRKHPVLSVLSRWRFFRAWLERRAAHAIHS